MGVGMIVSVPGKNGRRGGKKGIPLPLRSRSLAARAKRLLSLDGEERQQFGFEGPQRSAVAKATADTNTWAASTSRGRPAREIMTQTVSKSLLLPFLSPPPLHSRYLPSPPLFSLRSESLWS